MSLHNQTAIITGGGSGVGLAIATALAKANCNVIITSRRIDLLQQQAEMLNQQGTGQCLALECDVRNKAQVQQVAEQACQQFGHIDILINNAGLGVNDLVVDCPEENWDLVLDTNTKGTFLFSQAVLPSMIAQQKGYIINIASQAAKHGYKNTGPYCAAKFGVYGFGLALQEEVHQHGIRVHSLCPGLIQVPAPADPSQQKSGWLQTNDLADTVMFILQHPDIKFDNIGLVSF